VWGRRCRWGKSCSYSHDVPPHIAESYCLQARKQTQAVAALRASHGLSERIPPWLEHIQSESSVFRFDVSMWPLKEAIQEVLGLGMHETCEDLHEKSLSGAPPACPVLLQAHVAAQGLEALPVSCREVWHNVDTARTAMFRSEAYCRFLELYDAFCEHVIVPLTGDSSAYIQRPPTLRVHLAGQPQARGKIGMHKDGDYPGHCAAEINFWVPLTHASGRNSLFVESQEGRGDFQPLELEYGEVFRFHGYSCRHHTAGNDTGVTRVSFDLRAVPASCCPAEVLRGPRRGTRGLRIGDYPARLVQAAGPRDGDEGTCMP